MATRRSSLPRRAIVRTSAWSSIGVWVSAYVPGHPAPGAPIARTGGGLESGGQYPEVYRLAAPRLALAYALAGRVRGRPRRAGAGGGRQDVLDPLCLWEAYLLAGMYRGGPAVDTARFSRSPATANGGAGRRGPCGCSVRSPCMGTLQTSRRPKPTTSRPSPWPRNSACARSRPTATVALAPCMPQTGQREQARAGVVHRYRAVPCHGDDLLAAAGRGRAGSGSLKPWPWEGQEHTQFDHGRGEARACWINTAAASTNACASPYQARTSWTSKWTRST